MASVAHVAFWVPGSPVPGVQSHIFCLIAARWPPEHPPHYHRLHAPARSNWSMWWQTTVPIILKVTIFTMFASAKYVTAELWGFCYYHCLLATSPRGGREGGRITGCTNSTKQLQTHKPPLAFSQLLPYESSVPLWRFLIPEVDAYQSHDRSKSQRWSLP